MTTDQMQKLGKDSIDAAKAMTMASFGGWTKSAQAIAVEVADFSKKSFEGSAAAWEKLITAKSIEKAMDVQSEYLRSSYEDFMAEAAKLGELYLSFAKDMYRPFEGAFTQVPVVRP